MEKYSPSHQELTFWMLQIADNCFYFLKIGGYFLITARLHSLEKENGVTADPVGDTPSNTLLTNNILVNGKLNETPTGTCRHILRIHVTVCGGIPEIRLILEDAYFDNNSMIKGWLGNLSMDVQELTIYSELLTDIGESAFSGRPFEYLTKLVISDTRIRRLRRNSFLNSKLQTLEFRCNSAITVDDDALGPISDYLTILQFSQFNTFNSLLNATFTDAPQLVALYLSDNNIKSAEVNAFKGIQSSLQLLSLKNNKLATLPDGIFTDFVHGGEIDISGNQWNCNCSLLWLKYFYINNFESYFRNGSIPFNCTAGSYNEVIFCPNDTLTTKSYISTDSTNITTPAPSISSTANPFDYVNLECQDLTLQPNSLEGMDRFFSHSVKVRNGTVTYNFYQISESPNFEIKVLNSIGSDYMIWINSKNSSDYGCVHNVKESVVLDNLNYGMSYTICLLKESADSVTPFDCTSLNVPLEWKNLPWIRNKDMPIIIGAIIGTSLAIIVMTSLVMFYTIRQNPKLIKGNKRVVIVRNKSADALVMPNYERQPYIPPSVYTNSDGYLTPRNKMYEKINERRYRHLNTITDRFYRDMYSGSTSSLRTEFLHKRSSGVYEAPPLPPNHPSQKSNHFSATPIFIL
ncbi:hypothetical protein NQ317_013641 [Molorchus minor]|uniref:Uncharacterized protein n=1 Tax=Molorchus minor TaxID=1323400 RepID=A0ABQ9JVM8_9CUCU|nr:hypothetical protein NQ317_013641 [Molorchus minor]